MGTFAYYLLTTYILIIYIKKISGQSSGQSVGKVVGKVVGT